MFYFDGDGAAPMGDAPMGDAPAAPEAPMEAPTAAPAEEVPAAPEAPAAPAEGGSEESAA